MTPAQERIKRWRESPITFVREEFGVEPDAWQAKVLEAFPSMDADKMRIALQACAGPGKTAVLAWLGWNFLSCYGEKGEHPKGAAVSVTSDNLKDNLWPEFSKWQQRSQFLSAAFVWTKQRIFAKDHPETWWISARTFSKSANPEEQGRTLSGLHSKYILYLIDESGDITPSVLNAAEQGLSTGPKFGKILQAGNPTSNTGMLYQAASKDRHKWFVVRINGDPDDPNRSPRIDIVWATEQIKTYGRDNPWVMAYILGQFPPTSINQLIGIEEVEAAIARELRPDVYQWAQKRLGIDVARFGDDRTVLFPRQGLLASKPVVMRHNVSVDKPSVDIANRVLMAKQKWNQEREYFDDTVGWAHGAIDVCRSHGLNSLAVDFGGKAIDPRYFNKRSEMWMLMAEWIRKGGKLPNMPELIRELTAPTYVYQNGKFLLEPKDQIKKRLKFSPDLADALALTFAELEMPAAMNEVEAMVQRQGNKVQADYDPYAPERL